MLITVTKSCNYLSHDILRNSDFDILASQNMTKIESYTEIPHLETRETSLVVLNAFIIGTRPITLTNVVARLGEIVRNSSSRIILE